MEIVKYLCEFFFTNFWHWLGLWFILGTIFSVPLLRINCGSSRKEKDNTKDE